MIRKMLTATTVIAALLLSVLSFGGLTADAGPTCSYEQAINSECADAQALPWPVHQHACISYWALRSGHT